MTDATSIIERVDLSDAASYAHRPLMCDLVMKGGITSGVVYPLTVAELATTYRFRNIGGTSAGAISAAAAAADHRSDPQGFIELAELPARLGAELADLFRPQRACRRVFSVLLVSTRNVQGLGPRLGQVGSLVAAILAFLATLSGLGVLVVAALPAALLALGLWDVIEDHWLSGLALVGLRVVLLAAAAWFAAVSSIRACWSAS
jgi:Patatin-like phospholipase